MAQRIENGCVDCGLSCIGNRCQNRNVRRLYCDECGEEFDVLYKYDDMELCIFCLKEILPKVE